MDNSQESLTPKPPVWRCELYPKDKKPSTVGTVKTLKCSGIDLVGVGGEYSLDLGEKTDEYALKILKTTVDEQSAKEFLVTSYVVVKGDTKIKLMNGDEEVFDSAVFGLNLESVVENKFYVKPIPPIAGYYSPPTTGQTIALGAVILSLLGIFIIRTMRLAKRKAEFRKVVSKARYTDPFMDFNVEIRDYANDKKPSVLFLERLDDSIKKVFYRVFNETVSLNDLPTLVRRLKGLKVEPHEVRSFYVLDEEYRKFQEKYHEKRGQVFEEKKEFLSQLKKVVNKLKRYVDVEALDV